jgi:hypothetical protein
MATVTYSSNNEGAQDGSIILYTWALTTANADGAPIKAPEWSDRTWQATGTFGGATVTLQGSNDNVNWFPLTNANGASGGTAVTFTAAGGATPVELPLWVRPNLTVVGTAAVISVTMLGRRPQPLRA